MVAKRKAATTSKSASTKGKTVSSTANEGLNDAEQLDVPVVKAARIERIPNAATTDTTTATIVSLSQRTIAAYYSGDRRFFVDCDSNGAVELTLWPWFLERTTTTTNNDDDEDDTVGKEAAFSLVALSNRRGGNEGFGGGGGGDPRMYFIIDDRDRADDDGAMLDEEERRRTSAFAILLKLLLEYEISHISDNVEDNTDSSLAIKMEIVEFLIAAYSSMELRCRLSKAILQSSPHHVPRFGVLEGPLVDLVGLRLYDAMPHRRRHLEMRRNGLLRKRYGLFDAKRQKNSGGIGVGFLPGMVDRLVDSVVDLGDVMETEDGLLNNAGRRIPTIQCYISKSLELLLDLMSYSQTRPHVAVYLASRHVVVLLMSTKLYSSRNSAFSELFRQQVDMLLDSERVEVSTIGVKDTSASVVTAHQRAHTLQKLLHRHHAKEASEVIFAGVGRVCEAKWLRSKVNLWSEDTLYDICHRLRLVDDADIDVGYYDTASIAKRLGCTRREILTSILLYHQSSRPSDAMILASAPIYPTDDLLWDAHSVPPSDVRLLGPEGGRSSLSLPKLNARFLSPGDYLLRNFRLFRLESAYEIRGDIVDVVRRMRPACKQDGYAAANDVGDYYGVDQTMDVDEGSKTEFRGWARMGLELGSIKRDKPGVRLLRVDPPRLGEAVPSQVIAEIVLDLHSCATALTKEWDEIKEFDNLFLICVDASMATGDPAPLLNEIGKNGEERRVPDEEDCTFPIRYGVKAVRGCMVLEVRDEAGTLLSDPAFMQEGGMPAAKGKLRFLRVALDPAQFALDSSGRGSPLGINVYEKLNLVVRRSGRENNFKAVLETIRGLMKGGANSMFRSIPSWLMPVLLGYGGDPTMASYASPKMLSFASKTTGVTHPHAALDYGDTFLDVSHLRESFNGYELTVDGIEISDDSDVKANVTERKKYRVKVIDEKQKTLKVMATSYPFPPSYAGNAIRFTPIQVSAIRSGLSPGLTTIVGPPGTGKTDVAVQIIANLYHSFPTQRTVIVTHSNAALNDIFDKVMARGDVDERYMLRLGSGERNLTTTSSSSHDFTKTGRVAHILSRRSGLLEKVQLLSESLGLSGRSERGADGAPSYSCETSEYFYKHHVLKRVDLFEATVLSMGDDSKSANCVDIFPFRAYFPTLNHGSTLSLDEARAKFSEIKAIFDELAEYRPIELLRSQVKRTDYLLTKQARVVAMTCTHAAIARSHLVELGFHYDNIIMEESAQMLDVETFIPLLLQRGESDDGSSDASLAAHSRLKRICLIGDHNQLPPVVKNQTFCRYSHYDQSLFARLIHLGVPAIHLNKQGRARQEIARLYSWRYDSLGDLGHVSTGDVFQRANTGLAHTFQLIDVDDFEGRGESTPTAFFYQNVGEAEYCVALFQFMVLLGYPPEKISIITTYNGQKELILDILSQRCGNGTPLAGIVPAAVSTVDQYQGQQNDYIILSLVRTKAVGHLRDIRRLVVAVSRARLGLYVFCRKSLFCGCHELRHTMKQLADRPCKLQLIKGEQYPTDRLSGGDISNSDLLEVNGVSELGALVHSMQQKHIANQLLTT